MGCCWTPVSRHIIYNSQKVAHTGNASARDGRGQEDPGQSDCHTEFQVIQDYTVRPCHKQERKGRTNSTPPEERAGKARHAQWRAFSSKQKGIVTERSEEDDPRGYSARLSSQTQKTDP